ncbi:MAG: ROK family protein [Thermomicrobiales bacterium]
MAKGAPQRYGLGIDLGGTKILAGVIDPDTLGAVLATGKSAPRPSTAPVELFRPARRHRRGSGGGETPQGRGRRQHRRRGGWADRPGARLADQRPQPRRLRRQPADQRGARAALRPPVRLGNDVQGATIGELTFGAGKGVDRFLCVFVGTGVGGALVHHGWPTAARTPPLARLATSSSTLTAGTAAARARPPGAYASRTAITKALLAELGRGRPSILSKLLESVRLDESAPGGTAIRSGLPRQGRGREGRVGASKRCTKPLGVTLGFGLASAINSYNLQRIIPGGAALQCRCRPPDRATRRPARQARSPSPLPAAPSKSSKPNSATTPHRRCRHPRRSLTK